MVESLKDIINRVTENIESFQFNKSVAKIYEFVNVLNLSLTKNEISKKSLKWSLKRLSLILQPFVPHISEEIWESIGESSLCINQNWPIEEVKKRVSTKIAIQINGKTKEVVEIDEGLQKKEVISFIMKNKKIKKKLLGKSVKREIYVPGKILNLVI